MEDPIKVVVPVEKEPPMLLQEQQEPPAPAPFRTPHSRDYPVLGYE